MKTQAGSLVDDSKIEKACPMVFKNLKSRQQSRGEGSSIVVIEAFGKLLETVARISIDTLFLMESISVVFARTFL